VARTPPPGGEVRERQRLDGVAGRGQRVEHARAGRRTPRLGDDHDVGIEAGDDCRHIEAFGSRAPRPAHSPVGVERGDDDVGGQMPMR
jgi:hypothetical protein